MSRFTDFLKRLLKQDKISDIKADLEVALNVLVSLESVAPPSMKVKIAQAEKRLRQLIRDLTVFELLGGL
jgi:hypothetical protein